VSLARSRRRRRFYDFPLKTQLPILFPQPCELLALGGRQARATLGAIRLGSLHPLPQRRLRQIEIAGHGAHGLALFKHQANGAGLELLSELATRALRGVCHRSGHRIHLL
jgi:hypothetical protein